MISFYNIFKVQAPPSQHDPIYRWRLFCAPRQRHFQGFVVGTVNMLGGHCMPWATALIPAETESEHTYMEVFKAAHLATKRILTLRSCWCQECKSCTSIKELTENQVVDAMLRGTQYTTLNQLPIDKPLGDNCFQFFCEKVLKVSG